MMSFSKYTLYISALLFLMASSSFASEEVGDKIAVEGTGVVGSDQIAGVEAMVPAEWARLEDQWRAQDGAHAALRSGFGYGLNPGDERPENPDLKNDVPEAIARYRMAAPGSGVNIDSGSPGQITGHRWSYGEEFVTPADTGPQPRAALEMAFPSYTGISDGAFGRKLTDADRPADVHKSSFELGKVGDREQVEATGPVFIWMGEVDAWDESSRPPDYNAKDQSLPQRVEGLSDRMAYGAPYFTLPARPEEKVFKEIQGKGAVLPLSEGIQKMEARRVTQNIRVPTEEGRGFSHADADSQVYVPAIIGFQLPYGNEMPMAGGGQTTEGEQPTSTVMAEDFLSRPERSADDRDIGSHP